MAIGGIEAENRFKGRVLSAVSALAVFSILADFLRSTG
ncbi:hypothetical protein BSU04_27225 [Caballeronia sordidicola]|uniref:Uncharacterized protein n=1 Tax=Caballeronia sordidicola TaxID=196367 RepID=A0A226WW11_CABSO|nr:hypothetical protein BSU04_27225 [Caballeronia sordidicola]